MDNTTIRQTHRTLEPYHGMIYFVPEAPAAYADLGVQARGGYFGSRSAAYGVVAPETVVATFFNFHPDLVQTSLGQAWAATTPAAMLVARLAAVDAALRRVLGERLDAPEIIEAADLARTAAAGCLADGHPLYAAHAAQPWPDAPHLQLWWAQTLLREFRGDGHIAAMVTQDLSGLQALVIHAATGVITRAALQSTRGWADDEWAVGVCSLTERGWLDRTGALTDTGRQARQWVEDTTDALTTRCWDRIGDDGAARLRQIVAPLTERLLPEFPGGGAWLRQPPKP